MKQTKSGITYRRVDTIDQTWSDYEITVATSQLHNFGCIFVDDSDCPIDNEFELEEIVTERNGHEMKKIEVIVLATEEECECGNTSSGEGFFSCDADGNLLGADRKDKWFGLYKCARCGRFVVLQPDGI